MEGNYNEISRLYTCGTTSHSRHHFDPTRLKSASFALLDAIETARSIAVFRNQRTVLLPDEGNWNKGWELFVDLNDDGVRSADEELISTSAALAGVTISASNTSPLKNYVSYIGSGEGRKTGRANGGAFLAGTLKICPENKGKGVGLVLSRGGRIRMKNLTATECGF
jgi:type IV fimbrial biogenesis protein FimT